MIAEKEFTKLMENIGIELDENDYLLFARYAGLLQEWNEKVNLTAITDDEGIAIKHFADSLLPLTKIELKENCRLIDVGTGAGFPSVPMKLIRRDIHLTLLDSLDKRLTFLRHLCAQLGVDATMVHARAEDAGQDELHRERYDVATSRAVASLAELAELCLPLLRRGGLMVALKGSSGRAEAATAQNAITLCGGTLQEMIDYHLPNGDARTLIVIKKSSPTPPKYPRNSAQISKRSL
ncbi:MAG: 16S rRNA (guanine(527)-N(7))-methyltransferase RsmG [Angelakisella sp.]